MKTYKEIGDLLGMSANNVEYIAKRGLRKMKLLTRDREGWEAELQRRPGDVASFLTDVCDALAVLDKPSARIDHTRALTRAKRAFRRFADSEVLGEL